jgi:hypothetical protein
MNVFDEIRVELELLSDVELIRVARDEYDLDIDANASRRDIVDQCLFVEQHNCFA